LKLSGLRQLERRENTIHPSPIRPMILGAGREAAVFSDSSAMISKNARTARRRSVGLL